MSEKCPSCSKSVLNRQNSICCDICDNWYHLKCCRNLSKASFLNIVSNPDSVWFCVSCLINIFPFSNLNTSQLLKIHPLTQQNKVNINKQISKNYKNNCSVCHKTITNKKAAIPCECCVCLIHKKCSSNQTTTDKNHVPYYCSNCMHINIPFMIIDNTELHSLFSKVENNPSNNHTKYKEIDFNIKELCSKIRLMKDDLKNDSSDTFNCDYYDIEEFNNKNKDIHHTFSILHTNICSLQANIDKLKFLLTEVDLSFDIISLTETHNPTKTAHLFNPGSIEGYHQYDGITGSTDKGGCGFFISNQVSYSPRSDLDIQYFNETEEFEAKWIEVTTNKKNIVIASIYRHPNKSDVAFFKYLSQTLNKIKNENKLTMLSGDFNYNLLHYEKSTRISDFTNLIFSQCFTPTIVYPTRVVDNAQPSILDNIFINNIDLDMFSGNITDKISDHMPNFLVIKNLGHAYINPSKIKKRDFSKFNKTQFLLDLENSGIFEKITLQNDTNNKYNLFHDKFIEILNIHAPMKTLSKKDIKLQHKPWLTKGLLTSIKLKNKYYKKFLKTKDKFWYCRYKYYRDLINHLIRKSKTTHFKAYFSQFNNNCKKLWQGINYVLNSKSTSNSNANLTLQTSIGMISDPKMVANEFNKFFTEIGPKLSSKIKDNSHSFSNYLKGDYPNSFFLEPIEVHEVSDLIEKLDVSKASDIFDIPVKILKTSSKYLSQCLTHIFNSSFNQGVFPGKLKIASVTPVFKAKSKLSVNNYRPISILPLFSKILEQLMHSRLTKYLNAYNIIFNHQFGFQKNKSTSFAVLDIFSKIIDSF